MIIWIDVELIIHLHVSETYSIVQTIFFYYIQQIAKHCIKGKSRYSDPNTIITI